MCKTKGNQRVIAKPMDLEYRARTSFFYGDGQLRLCRPYRDTVQVLILVIAAVAKTIINGSIYQEVMIGRQTNHDERPQPGAGMMMLEVQMLVMTLMVSGGQPFKNGAAANGIPQRLNRRPFVTPYVTKTCKT